MMMMMNFIKVLIIVILRSRTFPLTFGMYPGLLLIYEFPYASDCSFHPSREDGRIIAEKVCICRDIS